MKCKNDNAETLQMAGPYAFGGAIRRKGTFDSLIRDRFGDIANLTQTFRIPLYANDITNQEESARRSIKSQIAGEWRFIFWLLALGQGKVRTVCRWNVANELVWTGGGRAFLCQVF